MAYCVHCGVKLAPSEEACPLCQTVAKDPKRPYDPGAEKPYPPQADDISVLAERRFYALLISLILALPAITCLVTNRIVYGSITWSWYVVGAMLVLWVLAVPRHIFRKPKPVFCLVLDVLSVGLYLLIIEHASGAHWFFPLALPILGLIVLQGAIIALLARRGALAGLSIVGSLSLSVGISAVGIEALINRYLQGGAMLHWSLFVLVSFVSVAIPFFVLEHRAPIKEALGRRWHI
jgi:hypothetical protein